ncbi:fibronectin type III domain-containing protein [Sulfurimonas sp.]|uniref:fibronectin type III domain-containing protein n=1 Tax=Sulfurimonas sp. TaxID=2022749 RepID=UPI00356688B6
MKLLNLSSLSIVLILLTLSGCGAKPKPKEEAVIDPTLPKVSLTKNATKSGMKSIALEWKQIKDKRVEGIYIYRESIDENLSSEDSYFDTINTRFATHYLDNNVKPEHRYNYFFVTYSKDAQGERSEVYQTATKPILNSVTWVYAASSMPRSTKIIWRPHTNEIVKAYEIQRRALDEEKWKVVARVQGRLSAEYIDEGLKDNHTYLYNVRAITYNGITSKQSEIVKSITKKLPLTITNLVASKDVAKKIKISWDKTQNKDFSYYKLYRADKPDGSYEFIAKLIDNSFEDEVQEDGVRYFYMVTQVDKDGLESLHQPYSTQGLSLSKPLAPAVVDAKLEDNKIVLKWRKNDLRANSYTVIKEYKTGVFESTIDEIKDIKGESFVDEDILPGTTYYYKVLTVDKNSITSEPSIEVVIEIPETKEEQK